MSIDKQARLQVKWTGVRVLLPSTLVLPWWPTEVTTSRASRWVEQSRPGDPPALLRGDPQLIETRVSYLLREPDGLTSVEPHLDWLYLVQEAKRPVLFWLGPRLRGITRVADVSVTEVRHNSEGAVSVADVAFTLLPASDATMAVGPVKRKRRRADD